MNFAVDWSTNATSALAAFWLAAPDRQAVTTAQARIDHLLAADPIANGHHVSEGLYRIDVLPLRALFEIDQSNRLVRVVSLSMFRPG